MPSHDQTTPQDHDLAGNHAARHFPFDVNVLPPLVQAQLAQYTVDLVQEQKLPRTNLACLNCRSRKIKCSGDRPTCKACVKAADQLGVPAMSCDYPTGHAKRKRKVDEESGSRSQPASNTMVDEGQYDPEAEQARTRRKVSITKEKDVQAQTESRSQATWNARLRQDGGSMDSPDAYLGIPPFQNLSANGSRMLHSSGMMLSVPPAVGSAANENQVAADQTQLFGMAFQSPPSYPPWGQEWTARSHMQQPLQSTSTAARASEHVERGSMSMPNAIAPALDETGGQPSQSDVVDGSGMAFTPQATSTISASQLRTEKRQGGKLRVPYFRYFGATAIAPGYKRVTADVSAPSSPKKMTDSGALSGLSAAGEIMDADGEFPHPSAVEHLAPIFNLHFSYFFPFWDMEPQSSNRHPRPAYLLNLMCALAARYSDLYNRNTGYSTPSVGTPPQARCAMETWSSKAKDQVNKQLAVANLDLVEALLMISWYEFGADRDGGLWMYSGMAIRMAQDLGLGRQEGSDRSHRLYWSLHAMDAIMAVGTGRTGMYQEIAFTTPAFPPLLTPQGRNLTDPFPYLVQILALAKAMTRILVSHGSPPADQKEQLTLLQIALNDFNTNLPDELRFQTPTFRLYVPLNQGGCFALIHLWFHALIILMHDPGLLVIESSNLPSDQTDADGREISISSAKSILDIVSFAELIDPKAISQPWINYPLYIAAKVFIAQMQRQSVLLSTTVESDKSAGHAHVASTASANYRRIADVLGNLEQSWTGVHYIRQAVIQKAEGIDLAGLPSLASYQSRELSDSNIIPSGWLSNDLLGFGLTGTMNTPSDNRYTFVLPPEIQGGHEHCPLDPSQLAIVDQQTIQIDLDWAEAYLASIQAPKQGD